jgi:hypothetical protein
MEHKLLNSASDYSQLTRFEGNLMNVLQKMGTTLALVLALAKPVAADDTVNTSTYAAALVGYDVAAARGDVFVKGLPVHSDVYLTTGLSDTVFYKGRLQSFPLWSAPVGLGVALQYVGGSAFEDHAEGGIVLRLQGNKDEFFGKVDARYFPTRNTVDGVVVLKSGDFGFDMIGSYQFETKGLMLRPALEARLDSKVSVGIEAKFTGTVPDVKLQYVGARVKVKM